MIQHRQSVPCPPRRVVVLGGSGFVGRNIVGFLQEREVPVVSLSSSEIDLCAADAASLLGQHIEEGDAVVVASGLTPDRGKDVVTLMRNLVMGQRLAEFLEEGPCAQVIYLSSDAVYGDSTSFVTEDTVPDPASLYGSMHVLREKMLSQALRKRDTPYLVLRPCALYGAGDTHNSYGPNRFIRSAVQEGRISLFGNGEEKRDHVHVRDVGRLIHQCLLMRSTGLLNVATGKSVSFRDLARAVAGHAGTGVTIECLPRQTPVSHRHFDNVEAIRAFPTFRFTDLPSGLAASIRRASVLHAA